MSTTKPVVRIIATGGTIAGVGPDRLDYTQYPELGEHLSIAQSLERVPEIGSVAQVRSEDFISVGSTAIGPEQWLRLARRVNQAFDDESDLAGIAITHGTATLEETAYFLHLTVKSRKPVVITGAMRPPTSLGTDADLNLLDAVRIAACPDAAGKGVLTVLNNEIQSARDVTKSNTYRVETFRPNELGFLGYSDVDGEVVFYRSVLRKHTTETPFGLANDVAGDVLGPSPLPRVDIVYAYAGADELLVNAVRQNHSDGLVLAGFGGGTYPPAMTAVAAAAAQDGMPVVLASRATAGRVVMTPSKDRQGFIVCDNLLPQKARILLMLGLTVTRDRAELQRMFGEF